MNSWKEPLLVLRAALYRDIVSQTMKNRFELERREEIFRHRTVVAVARTAHAFHLATVTVSCRPLPLLDRADKLQERKRIEFARVQRAMKNVRDMGRAGYMDADEVIRDLRNLEGELQVLPTMTNDHQQVRTNLMTCMEILRRLKLYWADAEGEDKRILAHSLFEEIVYDMDAKQITDFTVKAWAEPFLIYRAELLEDFEADETKNRLVGGLSNHVLSLDPNGLLRRKSLQMRRMSRSIRWLLLLLYPRGNRFSVKERNELFRQRFESGESVIDMAREFNITPQRVYQIATTKD